MTVTLRGVEVSPKGATRFEEGYEIQVSYQTDNDAHDWKLSVGLFAQRTSKR
jgi:hypothetical protein